MGAGFFFLKVNSPRSGREGSGETEKISCGDWGGRGGGWVGEGREGEKGRVDSFDDDDRVR